jgi:thiamine pyrophosphate-dependent acetolactate synthase large subunit-like protein
VTQTKLDRRAVVQRLLAGRRDVVVVAGLGAAAYDLAAAGDHDRNFYLWGAMGSAATIGLGLALAQPDIPVLVITGDGEMLMGMGAFATIGQHDPKNLTIVILDNEAYGETGRQATHTARGTDLSAVAKACGIADARLMATMAEVDAFAGRVHAVGKGATVATIKIDPAESPKVLPPRDGVYLMTRTRAALGFPAS